MRGNQRHRASYHHGDLRRALVEAALRLVSEQGVQGFSLREAAREVGVSPAAAYRHFEDKAALLAELAIDGTARLAAAMEEAIARAPGAAGTPQRAAAELGAIGFAYVEFAVAHPSHFRVMFGPWCEHPDVYDLPAEKMSRGRVPYQILVEALDGMVGSGAISAGAREGAEIAAWAAVHGLATLLVEQSLPLDAAERAQAFALILRTLLLGLGAAPALVAAAGRGRPAAAFKSPPLRAAKCAARGKVAGAPRGR